ncbi:hypothetical protein [Tenacibaculum maritimum]|uniref:hypothetical protein n=1 Tax=Tenacibaculum maritimum TaxID=107401 RepID=UPI0013309459|nr:hypothetical protein [Tenacibaculum maritimum]
MTFSETNFNFYDELNGLLLRGKSLNNSRNLKLNSSELQMRCFPPVFQEFIPCEEKGDGGCGNSSIMLSTENMPFNLHLNVGFNYNSNNSGTSNLNSHMSRFLKFIRYRCKTYFLTKKHLN